MRGVKKPARLLPLWRRLNGSLKGTSCPSRSSCSDTRAASRSCGDCLPPPAGLRLPPLSPSAFASQQVAVCLPAEAVKGDCVPIECTGTPAAPAACMQQEAISNAASEGRQRASASSSSCVVQVSASKVQTPRSSTTSSGFSSSAHGRSDSSTAAGDSDVLTVTESLSPARCCCCSFHLGGGGPEEDGGPPAAPNSRGPPRADLKLPEVTSPSDSRCCMPQPAIFHRWPRLCTLLHFLGGRKKSTQAAMMDSPYLHFHFPIGCIAWWSERFATQWIFALFNSFVMLVSLWGILVAALELHAGNSLVDQLKGYCIMLASALIGSFVFKLSDLQAFACTLYAALFASLATLVAAWGIIVIHLAEFVARSTRLRGHSMCEVTRSPLGVGIPPPVVCSQDVLVQMAASEDKRSELVFYFLLFMAATILVILHTCFCDRRFSEQLQRFVCI
ncbi:hypothetical protein Efla_002301 [Eimeria flavescens]